MTYYLEQHPNLKVPRFGWPRNRVSGVIGVHTTESGVVPAGADPGAENTAGYLARRDNHGSYHALADWDTRIKLVRPRYAAWADVTNNAHALSVSGAMDAARWRDLTPERAAGIVRNMALAAAELVQDAIADGLLDSLPPARRITAQQAIDGTAAGFYGHGETNPGTRYDPGQHFDWDLFLATYAAAIGGTITAHGTASQEDDLTPDESRQLARVFQMVSNLDENHLMNRVINIDNRVALLVNDIAYVKSADSPTLYERNGEDNTLRPITLTEWELTGKPYVTYPQAQFNELFKAS